MVKLETYELSLQGSFDCVQHVRDTLLNQTGPALRVAIKQLNDLLTKNKDLKKLEIIHTLKLRLEKWNLPPSHQ